MAWTTDELLTVQEAADVLDVSVQRMYNLRNLGAGPVCYRRGRRLVYPRSGLVAFLACELTATVKGAGASQRSICRHDQEVRDRHDALESSRAGESDSRTDGLAESV
jgi:Helix-turn-helix domain